MAAQKIKRMRAFVRFRNEIWCLDLAYVDKLAKENNGVKYLLFRQDLFDRSVNAKGMKIKDSQETVKAFASMIAKTNRPKKIWVDKGTEFAGAFKKPQFTREGFEIVAIATQKPPTYTIKNEQVNLEGQ